MNKLILLPTEKSVLGLVDDKLILSNSYFSPHAEFNIKNNFKHKPQILIALSDEPIKNGDLRYCVAMKTIGTCINDEERNYYNERPNKFKKVVASTDKSLTPNSWINISKSLWVLDEYAKDGKLPDVEFEMESFSSHLPGVKRLKTNPDRSLNIIEPKKVNHKFEPTLPSELMSDDQIFETIKSVTNCPTCGSECKVNGEGETHFYVPSKMYSREEVTALIDKYEIDLFSFIKNDITGFSKLEWLKHNLK